MTDRHSGYIITLKEDIREDDAEGLINLLYRIEGIIGVEPVGADVHTEYIAKSRMRLEIFEMMKELFK